MFLKCCSRQIDERNTILCSTDFNELYRICTCIFQTSHRQISAKLVLAVLKYAFFSSLYMYGLHTQCLWMFACLSTHVTVICNFGGQHSFDATAKYRHWLERADVTLLRTDVTLLLIYICTQWSYIMVLHYMSVPTFRLTGLIPDDKILVL